MDKNCVPIPTKSSSVNSEQFGQLLSMADEINSRTAELSKIMSDKLSELFGPLALNESEECDSPKINGTLNQTIRMLDTSISTLTELHRSIDSL